MKNKNIAYGVVGLIVGIGITMLFFCNKNMSDTRGMSMHKMSDGTMMKDGSSMEGMMHDMNRELEGKTGDEFDKAFLSGMIIHHKGAVDMAKAVLATSKRSELIKLANDIIVAQNKEIEMMETWQKAWFK